MADRPIDQLTLREIFTNAEVLLRDLQDHLQNAFHPKLRAAQELVKSYNIPAERDEIPDSAIRHQLATLLASDDYSEALIKKLEQHLAAIEERSNAAIGSK